jgi:hypothetical protein
VLREQNRLKNQRRKENKKKSGTLYAEIGRKGRRLDGGAFGKADPTTFNQLAEGTTAMRRPETEQAR